MKNITINLIGQSVLEEVLRENLKHINFEIKSFKKFNEIIHDSKAKNYSHSSTYRYSNLAFVALLSRNPVAPRS